MRPFFGVAFCYAIFSRRNSKEKGMNLVNFINKKLKNGKQIEKNKHDIELKHNPYGSNSIFAE